MKKEEIREELDTNLFKKIMDDKTKLITTLKEARDTLLEKLDTEYDSLKVLRKQRKELRKKIRLTKRAIRKDEVERFKLNRELSVQNKLTTQLTAEYSNEEIVTIDSSKYYPELAKKTR